MRHLTLSGSDGGAAPEFTPFALPELGDLSDLLPELPDLGTLPNLPDITDLPSLPELPDVSELGALVPDLAEIERAQEESVRELEEAQEEADRQLDGLLDDLLQMAQPGNSEGRVPAQLSLSSRFFLRWWLQFLEDVQQDAYRSLHAAEDGLAALVEEMGDEWDAGLPRTRQLSSTSLSFLGFSLERVEAEQELAEIEPLILQIERVLRGVGYVPELLHSEEGRWWFANWIEEAGEIFESWEVRARSVLREILREVLHA